MSLLNFIIANAKAQELIPCEDGTMADASIGCAKVPDAIVSSQTSILELLLKIGNGIVTLVAGLAVITFIYGAIIYALSLGNDEKLKEAKHILLWSTVGLIAALCAKYTVIFVLSLVSQ